MHEVNTEKNSTVSKVENHRIKELEKTTSDLKSKASQYKLSKERFDSLAASSNDFIWEIDLNGNYTYASPKIKNMLGYEPEEIIGKPFLLHKPDNNIENIGESISRVLKANNEFNIVETKNIHKDGHIVYLETSGVPFYDEKGIVLGYRGIDRDITTRKVFEKLLKEREEDYKHLFETSPIGIYRTTPSGDILLANPAMYKMLGYSSLEEFSQAKATRISYINSDFNRDRFKEILERDGKIESIELDIKILDGSIIHVIENARSVCNDKGDIVYYEGTLEDVTKRKKAEVVNKVIFEITNSQLITKDIKELFDAMKLHLQKVMDTANLMIVMYEKDTDSIYFPYMVDEKDGTFNKMPLAGTLNELVIRSEKSVFMKRNELDEYYRKLGRKQIGTMPEVWLGVPLVLDHKVIGSMVVQNYEDVSSYNKSHLEIMEMVSGQVALTIDRTMNESKKKKLFSDLENVNKELKDFAYIVSHDLKAPLRGLGSLVSWLISDYSDKIDSEGQELMGLLNNRVKRMNSLIEGILQYSRIGRINENIVSVDLNETLNDVIEFVSPPENIEINLLSEFPVIQCEKTRIFQVFQNLISNAIKYNDKPKGTINIGCKNSDEYWTFWVKDNGPGIDPKYHEKIFQIFQTLKPRDEVEGTGIGLTLVKKIIESCEGKIWLQSEMDEGSTFLFTIPKDYKTNTNIN